jgi:hypothetical protein
MKISFLNTKSITPDTNRAGKNHLDSMFQEKIVRILLLKLTEALMDPPLILSKTLVSYATNQCFAKFK